MAGCAARRRRAASRSAGSSATSRRSASTPPAEAATPITRAGGARASARAGLIVNCTHWNLRASGVRGGGYRCRDVDGYAGFDVVLVAASQGGLGRVAAARGADLPAGLPGRGGLRPASLARREHGGRRPAAALDRPGGACGRRRRPCSNPARSPSPPADAHVRVTARRRLELTPGHPGDGARGRALRLRGAGVRSARARGRADRAAARRDRRRAGDQGARRAGDRPGPGDGRAGLDAVERAGHGLRRPGARPAADRGGAGRAGDRPGAPELFGVRGASWLGSPSPL